MELFFFFLNHLWLWVPTPVNLVHSWMILLSLTFRKNAFQSCPLFLSFPALRSHTASVQQTMLSYFLVPLFLKTPFIMPHVLGAHPRHRVSTPPVRPVSCSKTGSSRVTVQFITSGKSKLAVCSDPSWARLASSLHLFIPAEQHLNQRCCF